jgi:hypothetical protein
MPEYATGGIVSAHGPDDDSILAILDNGYIMSAAEAEACGAPGLLKLINDRALMDCGHVFTEVAGIQQLPTGSIISWGEDPDEVDA